jgi:hypothetical protein
MTDKEKNKREQVIKVIRAILIIIFLGFGGLAIYHTIESNSLPIYLLISGLIIVPGVFLFREIAENVDAKNGKIKRFGRRNWLAPHLILGIIFGLFLILVPIFFSDDASEIFSVNTLIGFSILFVSIINIRGFYVSIYSKQIVTDGLNIYSIAKINSIKIKEDKLLMRVKQSDKSINLLKLSDDDRNGLIAELKERLPDVWQQA